MSKNKMKNSIAEYIFMKPPSSSSILSPFLVFALTCSSFNATLMVEELRGETMIVVGFLHRLFVPQHVQSMETIDSLGIFMAQAPWASPPCSSAAAHNKGCISPYLLALLGLVLFFTILYSEDVSVILGTQFDAFSSSSSSSSDEEKPAFVVAEAVAEGDGCDLFKGRWVWDDHRPMYEESECPYIPPQLTCQKHGRPDKDYQHWRWQPHACPIPSFNATLMLESLRNKRMMFVGDSLHRGQLVSLACLLRRTIPHHAKYANITYDFMSLFKAKDYNATFEFYWAPYLLASSSDNGVRHTIRDKQFVLEGSINVHGQNWKGVDILVFNTYMWWKPIVNMFKETSSDKEKAKIAEVPRDEAYLMALQSMVQWVEENMDPNKTRVFFTNMSPMHGRSIDWGGDAKGNCYNETTMIEDPNYWTPDFSGKLMNVTNEVLKKSKYPITFLNITRLSGYRKDAHTSIYKKQWRPLTPEQLANPASYADCTHWCLPGLQDTWNELLFAKLFYP